MQTKTTAVLGNIKSRNLYRKLLGGSLASLVVFLFVYALVPTLISEASATQDVTVGANWIATSLTLDPDYGNGSMSDVGHGDIAFGDIIPTSTADGNIGTERVIKKTIGIESSGKYYSIYLSMASDSSALKLNGDDSNIRIDPVTGTWDSPAVFSATSWGYAVPNTPVPTSASTWQESSTPEYPTFSQATTFSNVANLGIDLTKNNHGSIYNQDTWVAAPVLGSAQQIWKAETTNNYGFGGENGDNINNHFDIYYGIMIGSDTLAGTYENQLIYTALASAQAIDEISHNLLVSERFVAEGTAQTLKFDLASSQSGLIKPSQVYAYVVPHSDVTPNTIAGEQEGETRLETDEEVLIRLQNNLAQDSSYYDACSFNQADGSTDIIFDADGITITCSMPAETPVWDGGLTNSATATDGYYDIWITIPSYNANYISKTTEVGTNNRVASVIYAGLQSVDENGDKLVTEMQEMVAPVCPNTNRWGTALGADARVYDYTGSGNALASTSFDSAAVGLGTFALIDNRDDKTYLVRRLADGNCWMVQNLDLNLASFAGTNGLTSENTNLNTKSTWDPSAKMRAKSSVLEGGQAVADYQFQNANSFGSSLLWGSVCAAGTGPLSSDTSIACSTISVANNANSDYARSYNNDSATATSTGNGNGPAYLAEDQTIKNATECANITAVSQASEHCQMPGAIANDSTPSDGNGLTRDTKWQPEYISTIGGTNVNGSDTFTMRGSMYLGDYYNWYAATAETGQYATTGGNASDDICPKGWRLPVNDANADGSWTKLLRTTYGLQGNNYSQTSRASIGKVMQLPLSIPMTGFYDLTYGMLDRRGQDGSFWSSTATSSATNAYGLVFYYSGYFNPQYSDNKVVGSTIRCVAHD